MVKQSLGSSDIRVAPLAFGGNVFGWTLDEKKSFEILDAFVAAGFNFIDTADVYSRWVPENTGGESETIIGKWMKQKGNRDSVVIATKVGSDMGHGKSLTEKYILKAVEDSLKRLQTDYIDLYQTHWDDDVTPVEETLGAYKKLIEAGKVRIIGASNLSPERLTASLEASEKHNLPKYQTFQPLYNLYDRVFFEQNLQQICLQNRLSVITYYSLASGFLTGKYRSAKDLGKSPRGEGVKKYLDERGLRILEALDEASLKHHVQPASVAIAWLLRQPAVTAPIASATNLTQLDALTKAIELKLDDISIDKLNRASS